jgi:hypothetical protein
LSILSENYSDPAVDQMNTFLTSQLTWILQNYAPHKRILCALKLRLWFRQEIIGIPIGTTTGMTSQTQQKKNQIEKKFVSIHHLPIMDSSSGKRKNTVAEKLAQKKKQKALKTHSEGLIAYHS